MKRIKDLNCIKSLLKKKVFFYSKNLKPFENYSLSYFILNKNERRVFSTNKQLQEEPILKEDNKIVVETNNQLKSKLDTQIESNASNIVPKRLRLSEKNKTLILSYIDRTLMNDQNNIKNYLNSLHNLWKDNNRSTFQSLIDETHLSSRVLKYLIRYYVEKKLNHNHASIESNSHLKLDTNTPLVKIQNLLKSGCSKQEIYQKYLEIGLSKHQIYHAIRNLEYKSSKETYRSCKNYIKDIFHKENRLILEQLEIESISKQYHIPVWKVKNIIWRLRNKSGVLNEKIQKLIENVIQSDDLNSIQLDKLQEQTGLSREQLYQQIRKWKGKKRQLVYNISFQDEKAKVYKWLSENLISDEIKRSDYKKLKTIGFQLSDTQLYSIVNQYKKLKKNKNFK